MSPTTTMKKTLISFAVIIILIVPTVVSAAWYNPLTWFHNWTFRKPESIEIQTREEPQTFPVGQAPWEIQQTEKTIPSTTSEKDLNSTAVGILNTQIKYIDGNIELLGTLTTDIDRYTTGISRITTNLESMITYARIPEEEHSEMVDLIHKYFDTYKPEFAQLKVEINGYISDLQLQKEGLKNNLVSLSGKKVSSEEARNYLNKITSDGDVISSKVKNLGKKRDDLAGKFIKDKNYMGDIVYQGAVNYLKSQHVTNYAPVLTQYKSSLQFTMCSFSNYGGSYGMSSGNVVCSSY